MNVRHDQTIAISLLGYRLKSVVLHVKLYRDLGERLRNTTALSQNIQILINLNIITTLHELHFVGNGSIYVSKSCRHANHNTIPPLNLVGYEVSKPQRGVDILPQSRWPMQKGVLVFWYFLPGYGDDLYFLCFPNWTVWFPPVE